MFLIIHRVIILYLLLFGWGKILGSNNLKSPAKIANFDVKLINNMGNIAELTCSLEFLISSVVKIELNLPENVRKLSQASGLNIFKIDKNVSNGELMNIRQKFQLPKNETNFRIDIKIERNLESTKNSINAEYANFISVPIYFSIEKNEVKYVSMDHPERKYTDPPTIIASNKDQIKLESEYVHHSNISDESQTLSIESNDIYVYIAGKISYPYGGARGIPDVTVWLDWDKDNSPATTYTPYGSNNSRHVEYDKTDMNGNYYFSFRFVNSPQPANYYSDKIRVYATNSNSACYNHDLGIGAKIPEYYYLDISNSTTSVYSASANISNVEINHGSALRYLYRARIFSIEQLGYTPPMIRYLLRPNVASSCFCDPDESYLGFFFSECQNTTMSVPRIIFNHVPEDNAAAYHEYGHFIEWAKVGLQVYDDLGGAGHWFEKSTTHNIAWTEGWAEFYAAASLMYWYTMELPLLPEYIVPTKYQWMDYSQSLLSPSADNKIVEGAVACFLYSLWDGISRRAPNYTGDNEDVSVSGSLLLDRIQSRWNIFGQLIASTNIEAYKNALINGIDSKYHTSINSLYNSIINQVGLAHSATPTVLNIIGNNNSRTLSWNDNTAPTYYSWGYHGVDIIENNEQGFKIYRKATTLNWDGTLNGYTLVATVDPNVTFWTDVDYLNGTYSYVVVAYNSSGNSLPRAEFGVYYETPPTPTIVMSGSWGANPILTISGGGPSLAHYILKKEYDFGSGWGAHYVNPVSSPYVDQNVLLIKAGGDLVARYSAQAVDIHGNVSAYSNTVATNGQSLWKENITEKEKEIISEYSLKTNYPNPFNPSTAITYQLPKSGNVTLKIFDMLGNEVTTLVNGQKEMGRYTVQFDASSLASGMYVYRLRVNDYISTKKMLLLK